jgi:hypothetical protein
LITCHDDLPCVRGAAIATAPRQPIKPESWATPCGHGWPTPPRGRALLTWWWAAIDHVCGRCRPESSTGCATRRCNGISAIAARNWGWPTYVQGIALDVTDLLESANGPARAKPVFGTQRAARPPPGSGRRAGVGLGSRARDLLPSFSDDFCASSGMSPCPRRGAAAA